MGHREDRVWGVSVKLPADMIAAVNCVTDAILATPELTGLMRLPETESEREEATQGFLKRSSAGACFEGLLGAVWMAIFRRPVAPPITRPPCPHCAFLVGTN
jgi:hypothetical protein